MGDFRLLAYISMYLGTRNDSAIATLALAMTPNLGPAPASFHDSAWNVEKPNGTEWVTKLALAPCLLVCRSIWYRIWLVWMVCGDMGRICECYFARWKLVFYNTFMPWEWMLSVSNWHRYALQCSREGSRCIHDAYRSNCTSQECFAGQRCTGSIDALSGELHQLDNKLYILA